SRFDGTYKPDFARSIPDLRSVAPYLTDKNSFLFFSGAGTVEAVRLIVEGEPIESRDLALQLPPRIVQGQPLRQLLAASAGSRKFTLHSGPAGAQLSPAGELAWTPTADQIGPQAFRVLIRNGAET